MLSPRLKQQIYELWTRFWAGGLTNPITAIEQITYLLFLKQLEELDRDRVKRGFKSIYGRRINCNLEHHPIFDKPVESSSSNDWDSHWKERNENLEPRCDGHESSKWSVIKQSQAEIIDPIKKTKIKQHDHLSRYVFPWLRELDKILIETTPQIENEVESIAEDEENLEKILNAPMKTAAFQMSPDKPELLQYAIQSVDELFRQVGQRSANYDLMGDIFEYMLDEIRTSGKNGQFRTPRHIIRFMIELLDPPPGKKIVDPAAGTCGFLINSLLHHRAKVTPKENLRLEWNGTPLRTVAEMPDISNDLKGENFTAFENDETMARIGWMNMILHGVENPHVFWRDSLSKRLDDEESDRYDFAFANPPYTGNVDAGDLSENTARFPRNSKGPITDKSELLFVWLLLDLLTIGGKAAVIVPEGVLFNNTSPHRKLRQQLLFENRLEAVISLPAGIFQPYTGVKTSILIFQKYNETTEIGKNPVTEEVWFYEVGADGYTLDAKRNERPENNDLWDGQEKYKQKDHIKETLDYYMPKFWDERWREIDRRTLETFPELIRGGYEEGQTWAIHELFTELPKNPQEADAQIISNYNKPLLHLYQTYWYMAYRELIEYFKKKTDVGDRQRRAQKVFRNHLNTVNSAVRETINGIFELGGGKGGFQNYARKAFDTAQKQAIATFNDETESLLKRIETEDGEKLVKLVTSQIFAEYPTVDIKERAKEVSREFAKLDGFEIKLRSLDVDLHPDALPETKSWSARVRMWRRNDKWESEDGSLKSSHDENGNLRPEYVLDERLYDKDNKTVLPEYLESDCIEANDLNLGSGRYKPFTFETEETSNPAEIIGELQKLELKIQKDLAKLLDMVKV